MKQKRGIEPLSEIIFEDQSGQLPRRSTATIPTIQKTALNTSLTSEKVMLKIFPIAHSI